MKVATLKGPELESLRTTISAHIKAQKIDRKGGALPQGTSGSGTEMETYNQNLQAVNDNILKAEQRLDALNLYVPLECKDDPDSLHIHGFGDWMHIPKMNSNFSEKDRQLYETFVQGWLLYFEKHSSTQIKEDRTMFFDWNKKSEDESDLVIYLKPLHNKYYKCDTHKTHLSYYAEEKEQIGAFSNAANNVKLSPLPPPPSTTDPHQPPPPPPPPSGEQFQS